MAITITKPAVNISERLSNLDGISLENFKAMDATFSGRVGIGTADPLVSLHINNSSTAAIIIDSDLSSQQYEIGSGYAGSGINNLYFYDNTAAATRMVIDSAGNLLVGKTSSSYTTDGFEALAAGAIQVSDTSTNPVGVNRNGTDGSLISFFKAGTTVGSIGSKDSNLWIGTGDTGVRFSSGTDSVFPIDTSTGNGRDAAIDLGLGAGGRFKDLYLSNESRVSGSARGRIENFYVGGSGRTFTITGGANGALAELEFTASNHVGYVRKYYHCHNASGTWTVTERESSTSGTTQTVTISNNGTATVTVNVTSSTGSFSGGVLNYKMKYEFISVA